MTSMVPVNLSREDVEKYDSWELFVSEGQKWRLAKEFSQWVLGELALGVETKYGQRSIAKYSEEIGVEVKSLYEYRRVCELLPQSERMEFLSFRHHQIAARTKDPQYWLGEAHNNEWTTRQLYRAVKEFQTKDEKHEHDWQDLHYRRCKTCTKQEAIE